MKKIPKNLLLLVLILPVINLVGARFEYSRASFLGEIKDSSEEVSLVAEPISLSSDISIEKLEKVSLEVSPEVSSEVTETTESIQENQAQAGQSNGNSQEDQQGCFADLNSDGNVDNADVDIVTNSWTSTSTSSSPVADLNSDGIVDGADLGLVLGNWGDCEESQTCFADLNLDGVVDNKDVGIVTGSWTSTSTSSSPVADLNSDGIVDGADLGLVLGNWGDCGDSGASFMQSSNNSDNSPINSGASNVDSSDIGNTTDDKHAKSEEDSITSGGSNSDSSDIGNSIDKDEEITNPTTSVGGRGRSRAKAGEVLGASTCSEVYLNDYIKYGANNNPDEVKKLQTFLNGRGAGVPVNGFYGAETLQAVKDFQLHFNKLILKPWFDAGLMSTDTEPTGYVYKTTRFWINLMQCTSGENLVMPNIK